jgi:hypothetical protein
MQHAGVNFAEKPQVPARVYSLVLISAPTTAFGWLTTMLNPQAMQ